MIVRPRKKRPAGMPIILSSGAPPNFKVCKLMTGNPIMTVPFDAELFGHWWFEGPIFLST